MKEDECDHLPGLGAYCPWPTVPASFHRWACEQISERTCADPAQVLNSEGAAFSPLYTQRVTEAIHQGYLPIPKASSRPRIESNAQIFDFELTLEEVAHLDSLDEGDSTKNLDELAD